MVTRRPIRHFSPVKNFFKVFVLSMRIQAGLLILCDGAISHKIIDLESHPIA